MGQQLAEHCFMSCGTLLGMTEQQQATHMSILRMSVLAVRCGAVGACGDNACICDCVACALVAFLMGGSMAYTLAMPETCSARGRVPVSDAQFPQNAQQV